MNIPRIFVTLALLCLWASSVAAAPLQLAVDGKTEYRILLPESPSDVEKTAASELQTYLQRITGAEFATLNEPLSAEDQGKKFLSVGQTKLAEQVVDFNALKADEIRIQSLEDGSLILAGHYQRGTLYAVYSLLEDYCGVRWWTPDAELVPETKTLTLEPMDCRYAPKLIYRESFNTIMNHSPQGIFPSRLKSNGANTHIPRERGGHYEYLYFVHSFYHVIPVEEYGEHPEWFSEIDGVRKVGYPGWCWQNPPTKAFLESLKPEQVYEKGTQLCLTNDELRKEFSKRLLERLRKDFPNQSPEERKKDPNVYIVSVSQNDWHGKCNCEKCRALEEAEGTPAATLIAFVNKVAEDIEKEFPNVLVDTLAYQYTRKPPKTIKPRHNVVVRLCTIECSFAQPLTDDVNATMRDDIQGWSEISPQLFIWDYTTDFSNYLLPHPNLRVLAPNIRFFVDHKCVGLFEQGDYHSRVGDFIHARNWVIAHLLWNPSLDEKVLWNDFFDHYYGAAGQKLLAYLNYVHDVAESKHKSITCFHENNDFWFEPLEMNAAAALANVARAVVKDDPELLRRVNVALLSFDFNFLQRYQAIKDATDAAGVAFNGPADPLAAAQAAIAFSESEKSFTYREGCDPKMWAQWKQRLLEPFQPKPATEEGTEK